MEDQLRFELIIKEVSVKNARLQLYGPLSPISSDGWDSVGSLSLYGNMVDHPSEEVTSQSSTEVESLTQIASIFRSAKDLTHVQYTMCLPDPRRIMSSYYADRLTG